MERLITRLELDCALAIERVEGEKHGADRRREAVEAAAAATVTRRGKISGRSLSLSLSLSLLYNGRERESRYATYSNTIPRESGKSAVWRMGLRSGRSYP
jgi:hypothetical protein